MNKLCVFVFILVSFLAIIAESSSSAVASGDNDDASPTTPKVVPIWPPAKRSSRTSTVQDLHNEYNTIFRYGNRNAASHRWSTFLLDRSKQMTMEKLELYFSGFCAVSGSPVRPNDYNRYRLKLPQVAPDTSSVLTSSSFVTGYMHYCCWPCVCDTQDYIRIDTLNVTTLQYQKRSNGSNDKEEEVVEEALVSERKYFAVIGNPCDHPEQLAIPFYQPFYGMKKTTTLAETAKEVRCLEDGFLEGATLSDSGYIIISMFFDAEVAEMDDDTVAGRATDAPQPGRISTATTKRRGRDDGPARTEVIMFQDEREFGPRCMERAKNGYSSGMGEIFRKVCAISPFIPETAVVTSQQPKLGVGNEASCDAVQQ